MKDINHDNVYSVKLSNDRNLNKIDNLYSNHSKAHTLDLEQISYAEEYNLINEKNESQQKIDILSNKIRNYNTLRVILNEIENILANYSINNLKFDDENLISRNHNEKIIDEELEYLKNINVELLLSKVFNVIDKNNNSSLLFYNKENHIKNSILKKDNKGDYDEDHRKLIRIKLMNTIEFNLKKFIKSKQDLIETIGFKKKINYENKIQNSIINNLNEIIEKINKTLLDITSSLNHKISCIYDENVIECNKIYSFVIKKQDNLESIVNNIYDEYMSKILDDETDKKLEIEILKELSEIEKIENELVYLENKEKELLHDEEYIELVKEYKKYSNLSSL